MQIEHKLICIHGTKSFRKTVSLINTLNNLRARFQTRVLLVQGRQHTTPHKHAVQRPLSYCTTLLGLRLQIIRFYGLIKRFMNSSGFFQSITELILLFLLYFFTYRVSQHKCFGNSFSSCTNNSHQHFFGFCFLSVYPSVSCVTMKSIIQYQKSPHKLQHKTRSYHKYTMSRFQIGVVIIYYFQIVIIKILQETGLRAR